MPRHFPPHTLAVRSFPVVMVAAGMALSLGACSWVQPAASEPGATMQQTQPDAVPSGIVRSGQRGTGEFRTASTAVAPRKKGSRVIRYVVRVEKGLPIDVNEAAAQIQAILDDERGWKSTRTEPTVGSSFWLVTDPANADLTISIAAPPTVDRLCPLDTGGVWSCDDGQHVLVNSDRWQFLTPTYSKADEYRAYMINHEVGHFLKLGHASCAGPGLAAPVMMQQSKGLNGCLPNPWPTRSNS